MESNRKFKILIVGKRGGILQWYENLIAAQQQNTEYETEGFALNHNNIIISQIQNNIYFIFCCIQELF